MRSYLWGREKYIQNFGQSSCKEEIIFGYVDDIILCK